MGRRYHCEYCNKSFRDELRARRKHISGTMHRRMMKEHYDPYRDIATIFAEESAKVKCKRFQQTGDCPFGSNCKFSHYYPQQLKALEIQVEEEKARRQPDKFMYSEPGSQLSSWLQKRSHLAPSTRSTDAPVVIGVGELPFPFCNMPDLPPSLRPTTEQDFQDFELTEWG